MKHVWCIDEDLFTLKEGYVFEDYKDYENDFVYTDESQKFLVGTYKVKNIFDNKETAINIYKGMIEIERVKVHNEIERLKKYDEKLFEKLLNIE